MEIKEGDIYICKVKKLLQHGIIVYIKDDQEGFIHISELSKRWVRDVKDVAKEGDMLVCKVITVGRLLYKQLYRVVKVSLPYKCIYPLLLFPLLSLI